MDSKEYSSKNITATELLARHALELASIVPRADSSNGQISVYDGVDTNGEKKLGLKLAKNTSSPFAFNPHVYFRIGLYIVFENNIDDCFVQWRLRPHGEG